jgi:hypothetical protein
MVAKYLHAAAVVPLNKFRIGSYIYFNYYNWQAATAVQTFDDNLNIGNIKSYCEQIILEETARFKAVTGIDYKDFISGLKENAELINNFNILFTGGVVSKEDVGENPSGNYDKIRRASADIANLLHNGQALSPEELQLIEAFLENMGEVSANQYFLIQQMKSPKSVKALNNLSNGSYQIKINSDEYFIQMALSELYKQLNSPTSFAQMGGEKFDNIAIDKIIKQTNFIATKKMQDNIQKNVDSLGIVLQKIKNHEKISPAEISKPLSELQLAYGAQTELVGALEQKIVEKIGEKTSNFAGATISRESLDTIFLKIKNTGTKSIRLTEAYDPKTGSINKAKLSDLAVNKTADITVTMREGQKISVSQKRYNPMSSYGLHITSRTLSNLLGYASSVDPSLINQLNNPMLLNALYFAYGKKSYDYSRNSDGKLIFPLKIVSTNPGGLGRPRIDKDNNLILSKFALRLLTGSLSSINAALIEVNGELIPTPAYMELVLKNVQKTFGAGDDSTIFKDVQFNVNNFTTELSPVIKNAKKKPDKNEPFSESNKRYAIERNTAAKEIIGDHRVTIQTPFVTMEQYKSLLTSGHF